MSSRFLVRSILLSRFVIHIKHLLILFRYFESHSLAYQSVTYIPTMGINYSATNGHSTIFWNGVRFYPTQRKRPVWVFASKRDGPAPIATASLARLSSSKLRYKSRTFSFRLGNLLRNHSEIVFNIRFIIAFILTFFFLQWVFISICTMKVIIWK